MGSPLRTSNALNRPNIFNKFFRHATGFGVVHAIVAGLTMVHAFVQIIVFSRILSPGQYSAVVALTATGLYVYPVDQAIGRANFKTLRHQIVLTGSAEKHPEIVAALAGQMALLVALSLLVPSWLAPFGSEAYYEYVLFLSLVLFSGHWLVALQATASSLDLATEFSRLTLLQRSALLGLLGFLAWNERFLLFVVLGNLIVAASLVCLLILVKRRLHRSTPATPDLRFRLHNLYDYLSVFRTALETTVSELVLLSSPYATFSYVYGVGPAVVALDTIMKIARLATAISRTLAEILLPRQSRMIIEGDRAGAIAMQRRVFMIGFSAAVVPALFVAFAAPTVFRLLLGPNNVVPDEAAPVAALMIIAVGLYQPAIFALGYSGANQYARKGALLTLAGFLLFTTTLILLSPSLLIGLWAYAALLLSCAVFTWLLAQAAA